MRFLCDAVCFASSSLGCLSVFYDDSFVLSLPDDVDEAILVVLDRILLAEKRTMEDMLEARDLVLVLTGRVPVPTDRPIYYGQLHTEDPDRLSNAFRSICSVILRDRTARASKTRQDRFVALLGMGFAYTLSEADLTRIQALVNELRDLITASDRFEDDHKRRVLDRLEGLQKELHRRLSNLDRFYGLIGDAGVLLGKFGHDAKPFVDRIREIVEIVWRSQANAEQLPASAKPALLTSEPPSEE